MRASRELDSRAAYLAVIVVAATVGVTVGAGTAVAMDGSTSDLGVEASTVEAGATATYTIHQTVTVGDETEHDHVGRVVFNFTAADTSDVTLDDVTVEFDGEEVAVRRVQQGETTVSVDFDPQAYGDSDDHHVRITVANVVNPDAGTYDLVSEPMEDAETKIQEGVPRTSYTIESAATPTPETTPTETPEPTPAPTPTETPTETPSADDEGTPMEGMPGFGAGIAVVALLAAVLGGQRAER